MTREEVGSADLLRSSDEHRRGLVGKGVGVWSERAVVDETHDLTRRYPKPLMPVAGVRVKGFTITLDLELTRNPEAAALGRRVFEQVRDAIEHVISGGYADAVREEDQAHVASADATRDVHALAVDLEDCERHTGPDHERESAGDGLDLENPAPQAAQAHGFPKELLGPFVATAQPENLPVVVEIRVLHDASPIASAPGLDSPDSGVSVGEPAPRGDGFPPASPEAHTGRGTR